jgi:predicted nucleic acid-binding protein
MIVVSDSTILIGLVKIGKLDLLRAIFAKIFIPEEVFNPTSCLFAILGIKYGHF